MVAPLTGGGRRGDGDTTLLLLFHVVHNGCPFMDFADLMGYSCVKKDSLGGGCFTSVDVRHNSDITHFTERRFAGQFIYLLGLTTCNGRMLC